MNTLVIGDPHFKATRELEGKEYIKQITEIAINNKPSFIVLLGDILDSHEIIHTIAHNLAETLFENMSNIAPTFVLVGNHDYINNQQFLTTRHIFGPFKKWKNITIVDKPISVDIKDRNFVFVPYVPPGRFIEALNVLVLEGENWEMTDCIFAHQSFKGCVTHESANTIKDVWDEEYPLIISGHIHNSQVVGKNIMYPGSSIQQNYNETENKYVWMVDWEERDDDDMPIITKIKVGLKVKKLLTLTVDELLLKDTTNFKFLSTINKYHLTINVIGTSPEINNLKRNKFYNKLIDLEVKFKFEQPQNSEEQELIIATAIANSNEPSVKDEVSYHKIFKEIINTKDKYTRNEYATLFGVSSSSSSSEENNTGCNSENDEGDNIENDEDCDVVRLVFIDKKSPTKIKY